jgi:hypothetical protein
MSAAPAGALTAPRLIARISWRVENTVAWLISCSVRIRYQRDLRYQHEPWSRSLRVAECGKYRVNPDRAPATFYRKTRPAGKAPDRGSAAKAAPLRLGIFGFGIFGLGQDFVQPLDQLLGRSNRLLAPADLIEQVVALAAQCADQVLRLPHNLLGFIGHLDLPGREGDFDGTRGGSVPCPTI